MPRFHRSIEIKAPIHKVFSFIEDPRNGPEVITNLIEVKNVSGKGQGSHYDWTWKMAGMRLKGESTFVEDVPDKRLVMKGKGDIESTWTYDMESRGEVTVLDLDIDYKIPIPLVGKLAEKVLLKRNEREGEMNLQNLKERLEV
ncbi:MAG TPA: SRPBCC family protein [Deltaproteobacteria bacterium]|nr:SRPBCC family protein [Deltaproteobacteria bacterium]HPR56644.1 SRPBCC family protein [Deltaproteobacteria bacterium]HXK47557.1 SRPBCC family protein [Deltaproteobacteria bacterium]